MQDKERHGEQALDSEKSGRLQNEVEDSHTNLGSCAEEGEGGAQREQEAAVVQPYRGCLGDTCCSW